MNSVMFAFDINSFLDDTCSQLDLSGNKIDSRGKKHLISDSTIPGTSFDRLANV